MARRKKTELPKTELNITSMMDLVLNLLAFFVLTSSFALAELPKMQIPDFHPSVARSSKRPDKVVVSIIPDGDTGRALTVKVGPNKEVAPTDTTTIVDLLSIEKQKSKEVTIDLRADKSLQYDQVAPVMKAIAQAGITQINLVAVRGDEKAAP